MLGKGQKGKTASGHTQKIFFQNFQFISLFLLYLNNSFSWTKTKTLYIQIMAIQGNTIASILLLSWWSASWKWQLAFEFTSSLHHIIRHLTLHDGYFPHVWTKIVRVDNWYGVWKQHIHIDCCYVKCNMENRALTKIRNIFSGPFWGLVNMHQLQHTATVEWAERFYDINRSRFTL